MMKRNELKRSVAFSQGELSHKELMTINGGEDGDLAYIAGYSYVFTTAHLLTGGVSTYVYLFKKLFG